MTRYPARVVLAVLLLCLAASTLAGREAAGTEKTAALRAAQSTEWLRGPVAGFLTDEAAVQIRAILGVPGAAIAGEPLPLAEGVSRIRVAPGHRYAVLEFTTTALPAVLNLEDGGEPLGLAGTMAHSDLLAFSPTGRSAAFYSETEQRLQVLTNLPREARMVRELALADAARIAVSDDGDWLLVASPSGAVTLLAPDGGVSPAFQASGIPILAFLPNRLEALVCDTARGEIHLLGGLDALISSRVVATGLVGVSVIASSADGATMLAVAAEVSRGWRVNLTSGEVRTFDLPTRPESIEPMRVPDSYLISARAGEPAWLLVAGDGEIRAYFVPAVTKPEADQ